MRGGNGARSSTKKKKRRETHAPHPAKNGVRLMHHTRCLTFGLGGGLRWLGALQDTSAGTELMPATNTMDVPEGVLGACHMIIVEK
jgi:hypothetical protein